MIKVLKTPKGKVPKITEEEYTAYLTALRGMENSGEKEQPTALTVDEKGDK